MTESLEIVIALAGCDDTTYFRLNVTEAELQFIQSLAAKSVTAKGSVRCKPVLRIGNHEDRQCLVDEEYWAAEETDD